MNHLVGFVLFWIGIGMIISLIFAKSFLMVLIAIVCLIIGYNLFCSC